jgi:hypothetical protein
MSTYLQKSPFVRSQRNFPYDDVRSLSCENDKAHIEYASKINDRTIGIFANMQGVQTGDKYYIPGTNQPHNAIRYLYQFISSANIPLGFPVNQIDYIVAMYGSYYNSANNQYYGLIASTNQVIPGQIGFYLDFNLQAIVFNVGAGAPSITQGLIVIEWIP